MPLKGDMVNGFIKGMMNGLDPMGAADDVIRGYIRTIPGVSTLPKAGGIYINSDGQKVRIYPNGDKEELE